MDKVEKFELNPKKSGITESDGVGATWGDIWDYQVPYHVEVQLKPGDVFACYLIGADTAQMPASTLVQVVKRDVTNLDSTPIVKPLLYQVAKNFTDKKKLLYVDITAPLIVTTDEHIVVQVNGADATGTGGTDASASHFKLATTWKRRALG